MAHYMTLQDFRFADDVDDIRGATLYSFGNKVGKIEDVVFAHETGEIRYLVAGISGGRRVLVPPEHVLRSTVDEDEFDTDLSREELEQLPAFDEKLLEQADWCAEEDRRERQKRSQRVPPEFKEKYEEQPVVHRKASDRTITPEPGEMPGAPPGERQITAAELTPRRIADKFAGPSQPMVSPTGIPGGAAGAPDVSSQTTMQPAVRHLEEEDLVSALGPRWLRFQQNLNRHLPQLRMACTVCADRERVA